MAHKICICSLLFLKNFSLTVTVVAFILTLLLHLDSLTSGLDSAAPEVDTVFTKSKSTLYNVEDILSIAESHGTLE